MSELDGLIRWGGQVWINGLKVALSLIIYGVLDYLGTALGLDSFAVMMLSVLTIVALTIGSFLLREQLGDLYVYIGSVVLFPVGKFIGEGALQLLISFAYFLLICVLVFAGRKNVANWG